MGKRIALIGIALFLLIGSNAFINFLVDLWWFEAMEKSDVFWRILSAKAMVFVTVLLVFSGILALNVYLAFRFTKGQQIKSIEGFDIPSEKILKILTFFTTILVSLLGAIAAVSWWEEILHFLNPSDFNIQDPIFQLDIGFYIFQLPFYKVLRSWVLTSLILSIILSILIYFLKGTLQFIKSWENPFLKNAKYHLSFLLMLLVLFFASGFWLDRYELLFSESGVVFGAGYTDVHARLFANSAMTIISVLSAFLILLSIFWKRGIVLLLGSVSILVITYLGLGIVYPTIQQKYFVAPNELMKEKPYLEHNIKYTRLAYGLSKVERRNFELEKNPEKLVLTKQDLEKNEGTINNIRLWDWRPLLTTYKQIQEIRPYYTFKDVDVDRYRIGGKIQQVMIAPRELSYEEVPENAKNWVNQHFEYTHGQGLVMSPVNRVSSNGLPEFFIKDIPPQSVIDIQVKHPEIYYGEETNHYIFTKTKFKGTQIDDISSKDQISFTNKNLKTAGVSIASFWKKIIYGLHFKNFNIVISDYLTDESNIHYFRNIREMVIKIAPFLVYDKDPYVMIHEGGIYWIIDAYTFSNRYPYSQPSQNGAFNYIRNSVKVIVNARTGETQFIVTDEDDPLVKTYRKIFPNLFRGLQEIPKNFKDHFRYPQDLFKVQAEIYLAYHMDEPEAFYKKEDMWEPPREIYNSSEQPMEPYYITMRSPESKKQEFMLILPFTPFKKNNMIAWMAAHNDSENYGKLLLYEFPKKQLVYGPMQIEARIDQSPQISELLTLWNQKGSNVIRGNLITIPIEKSLLFVEPLYLQAEQGQMPQLKRVIVSYNEQIMISESLEGALLGISENYTPGLFSSSSKDQVDDKENLSRLLNEARQLFEKSQRDLKTANWKSYGETQERLGNILKSLQKK